MLRFFLGNKTEFLGMFENFTAQFLVAHPIKFARFATLRTLNALARQDQRAPLRNSTHRPAGLGKKRPNAYVSGHVVRRTMTNLLRQAIDCDDGDRAARIIQDALGIESNDVVNYCFPKEWPADREQRASYIGEWLKTEARYLA
jgi:hypothetical protein